jgi:hypothetical protein
MIDPPHGRSSSQQFLYSVPNHNPITNALSMNYYNNPYIRKEILRGSKQSSTNPNNFNASTVNESQHMINGNVSTLNNKTTFV